MQSIAIGTGFGALIHGRTMDLGSLLLPRLHGSCFQAGVNEELPEPHGFLLGLSVLFCCSKEDLPSTCCMN